MGLTNEVINSAGAAEEWLQSTKLALSYSYTRTECQTLPIQQEMSEINMRGISRREKTT